MLLLIAEISRRNPDGASNLNHGRSKLDGPFVQRHLLHGVFWNIARFRPSFISMDTPQVLVIYSATEPRFPDRDVAATRPALALLLGTSTW